MPSRWPSILADAVARGLTAVEVAEEQGVSRQRIHQVVRRYGVDLPTVGPDEGQKERTLAALLSGATVTEAARTGGVAPGTARKLAATVGASTTEAADRARAAARDVQREEASVRWRAIFDDAARRGIGTRALAREMGVDESMIHRARRRYALPALPDGRRRHP